MEGRTRGGEGREREEWRKEGWKCMGEVGGIAPWLLGRDAPAHFDIKPQTLKFNRLHKCIDAEIPGD